MRKTPLALFGAALIAAAPLLAMAQPAPGPGAGPGGGPGPRGARGPGAMFDQVDANRDGRVTWDETWIFIEGRFRAADRDGNGGLTQAEMQEAMQQAWAARRAAAQQQGQTGPDGGPRRGPPDAGEMMGAMFRALDADRNGQVTLVEIRPAVEARFRALDANGDNVVERSELPQRHHRGPGRPGGPPPAAPANPG